MKRKRYAEHQIVVALQRAESGTQVAEICRKMVWASGGPRSAQGISEGRWARPEPLPSIALRCPAQPSVEADGGLPRGGIQPTPGGAAPISTGGPGSEHLRHPRSRASEKARQLAAYSTTRLRSATNSVASLLGGPKEEATKTRRSSPSDS